MKLFTVSIKENRNINICTFEECILDQPSKLVLNNKRSNPKLTEVSGKLLMGYVGECCKYLHMPDSYFRVKLLNFVNSSNIQETYNGF